MKLESKHVQSMAPYVVGLIGMPYHNMVWDCINNTMMFGSILLANLSISGETRT